ncbi:MAG: hypothetical protein ACE5EA_00865 [Nitrospirota bacterium]
MSLKVDFLEDPFSDMWQPQIRRDYTESPVLVDALELIYYRKLYAVTYGSHPLSERIKDLVDLYFLNEVNPIFEMIDYTIEYHIALDWLRFFQRLDQSGQITLDRVKLLKPLEADLLSAWLKDIAQKGIASRFGGDK